MYYCKKPECKTLVHGEHTVKEIMAMGKLCPACLSEKNKAFMKRVTPKEAKATKVRRIPASQWK